LKLYRKILYIMIALFVAAAADIHIELNYPKLIREWVETDKIQQGEALTVLHLTDLHSKWFGGDNERLFGLVSKADPDIIVCTGDVVDKTADVDIFAYSYTFFEGLLRFGKPVFYVSGNHEPWDDWEALQRQAVQQGVRVLVNQNETVQIGTSSVTICGIEDFNTKYHDLNAALAGTDNQTYTILLSHTPAAADQLPEGKVDLMISGHTHGGQVRLPVIKDHIMKEKDILRKYSKGFYRLGATLLYVDSGLGTTRVPLRFLNRSQMTIFEIKGM